MCRGWIIPRTPMLTSHRRLRRLRQYWHDGCYDARQVRVWYTGRGAPYDRSMAPGSGIRFEPYYLNIRTPGGEKPVPYPRVLHITYNGAVVFENQKARGLAEIIAGNARDTDGPGT